MGSYHKNEQSDFGANPNKQPSFLPPPPPPPLPLLHKNPLLFAAANAQIHEYHDVDCIQPTKSPQELDKRTSTNFESNQRPPTPPATSTLPTRKSSILTDDSKLNFSSIEPVNTKVQNNKVAENDALYYLFTNNAPKTRLPSPNNTNHTRNLSNTSVNSNISQNRFVNTINVVDPIEANYAYFSRTSPQVEETMPKDAIYSNQNDNKKTLFIKNNNRNLTNVNNQIEEKNKNKNSENSGINTHYEL